MSSARWGMVATSDPVDGVGHSRQAAWTIRLAITSEDGPDMVIKLDKWLLKTS
jgi:hypothetical protein